MAEHVAGWIADRHRKIGWRLMAVMMGLTALVEAYLHLIGDYDERRFGIYQRAFGGDLPLWGVAYAFVTLILVLPDFIDGHEAYNSMILVAQHFALLAAASWVLGLHVLSAYGEYVMLATPSDLSAVPWPLYVIAATLRGWLFGRSRDRWGNWRLGASARDRRV